MKLFSENTIDPSEPNGLQELLAKAPAAIGLISGPEHRCVYVNDVFVQVTGRTSGADFLGKTIFESLPEINDQRFPKLLDHVYRTGRRFVGRSVKIHLSRSPRGQPAETYFDFVFQPIRAVTGEISGILLHAVETTDQQSARKLAEQSEERLRLVQTAAQMGVWEWDPLQNKNSLSPELHRIFGTDPGDPDFLRQWTSRVHPDDLKPIQQAMDEGQQSGNIEVEYRYRHPRLGERWFYCKGRRLPGESSLFGVLLDITDRKEIDETRHRLAAIVESSDDAIISKNLNGIVTSWNKSAEMLFGYKAEEIVGRSITLIIPPELQDDEPVILSKLRRGEKIDHFETVRIKKNGERVDVSLTISPIRDASGKVVGAAKIIRDITERRKIERALRVTEKLAAAGRLAATVAHEINNPLEAVTNLVYLAKRDLADKEKTSAHLELAGHELDRVAHIARQTLGFYRDSSSPLRFDVIQVLDDLLFLYEKRLQVRKIEVVRQYGGKIEITALAGEIRQAFSNLISNSIDAMPDGGTLVVRVSRSRQWGDFARTGIRITVLDTGTGIPVEHRENIFQPFFTTKSDVGTGLGLWITRTIVDKHRGTIHVRTRTGSGHHGTAFSIFLPLDEQSGSGSQREGHRREKARPLVA